jgi:hypothetical protein
MTFMQENDNFACKLVELSNAGKIELNAKQRTFVRNHGWKMQLLGSGPTWIYVTQG